MTPYERRGMIYQILKRKKFQKVEDLAKELFTSESSIRRDLVVMENNGEIERTRGGAIFITNSYLERPISISKNDNLDKKNIIAELAFDFVKENDYLFLDSSSTCFVLAKKLTAFKNLSVITNGLLTAHILSENSDSNIYCTGGSVYSKRSSTNGIHACNYISNHYTNISFVSCKGIDDIIGISDLTDAEAQVKQYAQKFSSKTIVLVDSSKFNKTYFSYALPYEKINVVISDAPFPENIKKQLEDHNIDMIFPVI